MDAGLGVVAQSLDLLIPEIGTGYLAQRGREPHGQLIRLRPLSRRSDLESRNRTSIHLHRASWRHLSPPRTSASLGPRQGGVCRRQRSQRLAQTQDAQTVRLQFYLDLGRQHVHGVGGGKAQVLENSLGALQAPDGHASSNDSGWTAHAVNVSGAISRVNDRVRTPRRSSITARRRNVGSNPGPPHPARGRSGREYRKMLQAYRGSGEVRQVLEYAR